MFATPEEHARYADALSLVYRGDIEALRRLLDAGYQTPDSEYSLLHAASLFGRIDVMTFLVARGDDPDCKGMRGETCLMVAARKGRVESVRFLLDSDADPSLRDDAGMTMRGHARRNKIRSTRGPMLDFLRERFGEDEGDREEARIEELVTAIRSRTRPPDEIIDLLRHGGGLDQILHWVPMPDTAGAAALDLAVREGDIELARCLLEGGANPESNNGTIPGPEESPLMQAAYLGNREMIELLLEHGANVNAINPWSQTPLHYAVNGAVEGDSAQPVEAVRLLLARGGDPHAQAGPEEDTEPQRALDYAVQGQETIRQAAASQQGGDEYFAPRMAALTEIIDLLRAAM
jgi:ankyrin repeat protein